jgi:oligosaccharide repeat unit polymerase
MTPALAVAALIVLGVVGTLCSRAVLGSWFSPISIYFAVWLTLALLVATPLLGLNTPSPKTWWAFVVAAGAFVLGSLYHLIIVAGGHRGTLPQQRSTQDMFDDGKLLRWFRIGVVALAAWALLQIVTLLPVLHSAGGFSAIFSNGIAVRRALYSAGVASAGNGFDGGSLFRSLVGYILFLGTLTLFWAPAVARRGKWLLSLSPLLIMAIFSLITLERFAFVYSVCLSLFAQALQRPDPKAQRQRSSRASKRTIVLLAVLLPAMIYAPLKLREPTLTPARAARSVGQYFAGGAAALDQQVQAFGYAPREHVAGHGLWTFWGEATIAARLGIPMAPPPKDLPYVDVGTSAPVYANVYTYLVYFVNDFGWLGLVVGPFLLGLVATLLLYEVRIRGRWSLLPAACILLTTVAMSFFGLSLIRDARYLVIAAAAPLIGRLLAARVPQQTAPLERMERLA